MSGLYPHLSEPWSDVDDEGIGDDVNGSGSGHYYNGRGGEKAYDYASPVHYRQHSNRSARESTDAVNLSDFQDHYLKHSYRQTPGHDSEARKKRSDSNSAPTCTPADDSMMTGRSGKSVWISIFSQGMDRVTRGMKWVVGASLWKKAMLAGMLGLLCAMLFGMLRKTPSKDNYLQCPSPSDEDFPPCIPDSELRLARVMAHKMTDILHNRAAQYICGVGDIPNLAISLGDLKQLLPSDVSRDGLAHSDMKNVFYLILMNPHWDVRWMDRDNKTVTDWTHYPQSTDLLVSNSPSIPFKCGVLLRLAALWRSIQWVLIALLCVVVVYVTVALYHKKRRTEASAVYALVGRIMDVMKYHYKKSCSKKDLLPYLAIIHVRDMLIPPSERKAKEQLWGKAVDWIACHESRVRVETRRIAGEDFEVWRWIQADPPPTEEPVSLPAASSASGRSQGNWHGSVFDHYPPEITTKVAPPAGTPSLCIRLKNMFEPVRRMEESQCQELENAVLERCHTHGAVVHVWVDKKSPFGCVYLKMGSRESAMGAYNALHGGWYKGKLVTAKYIPEAKYHKWFPLAANAKNPIIPS